MADAESTTVSLPPRDAEFVAACVASGAYPSAGDVVHAGLKLLAEHERERRAEIQRVHEMLEEGARQIDRGEVVDGEGVFRRLEEKHRRLAEQQKRRDDEAA